MPSPTSSPHRVRNGITSPLLLWLKILVCLIAVDFVFFRLGVVWNADLDFGVGLEAENWRTLFAAARETETRRSTVPTAVSVGSSIVIFGVDQALVSERLRGDGVPSDLLRFVTHGSTATDSAVMAWSARAFRPWLVIYGAAVRDFPKSGSTDSAVARIFYDSSAQLPRLPRATVEGKLDGYAKRYWKLYRYRYFTAAAVQNAVEKRLGRWATPWASFAAELNPPAEFPPEAAQYFALFRISPKSWDAWARWRQTRKFSDYLVWLQLSGRLGLSLYKTQTLANFGPNGNWQVDSLRWMLANMEQLGTRTVLIYFPENPAFRDPAAAEYFDPKLSDTYAELFKREAAAHGARFEDLRNFLLPEDFYDLVHANVQGTRKVSNRIADIIEEEWHAHAPH